MSEQLTPKPEKSQEEIHAQIKRISEKLIKRASLIRGPEKLDPYNEKNTLKNTYTDSSIPTGMEHTKENKETNTTTVTTFEPNGLIKRTVDQSGNVTSFQTGSLGSSLGTKVGNDTLTNEQTIHTAAGVLAQTRDEIASREIDQRAQTAKNIETILQP